jgi:cyclic pyranopterin phosphate synthase
LEAAEIQFQLEDTGVVFISSVVRITARTGVEMEALVAVSTAALTIYDMCKSVDRGMQITAIQLEEKTGGRSGHFLREPSSPASQP